MTAVTTTCETTGWLSNDMFAVTGPADGPAYDEGMGCFAAMTTRTAA
jgi:hypothetical protein